MIKVCQAYVHAQGEYSQTDWDKYGASGIMTFLVNHDGVVYEKGLGPQTEGIVAGMTKFDPDGTWRKAEDSQAASK